VQIDNSSRLRAIGTQRNFEISPRLPVNYPNRTETDKYNHYKPSNSYPGPSHIYVPANMVPSSSSYPEPPVSYVRPPPPPPNPANSYVKPPKPSYGRPPQVSSNNNNNNNYNNRPTQAPPASNNPTTLSPNIPNTYLPPISVVENTTPPENTYLPPQSTYLPPESNTNKPIITTTAEPATTTTTFLSPSTPQNFYIGNLTELVPPKEEKEEVTCPTQKECCDESSSSGKLVIPIALKNRNSTDCCQRTAKLVVPLQNFDSAAIDKLKEIFENEEIDAEKIIRKLLENLL
jgi:hypothetical protein